MPTPATSSRAAANRACAMASPWLARNAFALRLGGRTSSHDSAMSVPANPENTGTSRSTARSLRARNPVPQPALVHFCPPEATTSATS